MRAAAIIPITLLSLIPLFVVGAKDNQKPQWKGKIEYENGVKVIKNPEKPLSEDAGRIVLLKEVMKISEVGNSYYFKYPCNLKVAPDGSLFVQDHDQLLRFDKTGKFLHNYFKKGQGEVLG